LEEFIVAFIPVSEDEFSTGKMPPVLLRPSNCGKVVGKHDSEAIITTVPYEELPKVDGKTMDGLEGVELPAVEEDA
jgi:hypothetical protein